MTHSVPAPGAGNRNDFQPLVLFGPQTNAPEPMEVIKENPTPDFFVRSRKVETTVTDTFQRVNLRPARAENEQLNSMQPEFEQRNVPLEEKVQQQTAKLNLKSPSLPPFLQLPHVPQIPTIPPTFSQAMPLPVFTRNEHALHTGISAPTLQQAERNSAAVVSANYLAKAKQFLLTGKECYYESALTYTNLAIIDDQKNADGYAYQSEVLRLMQNYYASFDAAEKALGIDPNNIIALVNKGIAFTEWGRCADSLEINKRVLEIQPNNRTALINKSENLYQLGHFKQAIETITFAFRGALNDPAFLELKRRIMEQFSSNSSVFPGDSSPAL